MAGGKRISIDMMKGEGGCAQLNHCFENQNDIEEPLWRSALSIAAFCVDGDKAAHKLSNQHETYDAVEVDTKVNNLRNKGGPHHCSTFAKLNL